MGAEAPKLLRSSLTEQFSEVFGDGIPLTAAFAQMEPASGVTADTGPGAVQLLQIIHQLICAIGVDINHPGIFKLIGDFTILIKRTIGEMICFVFQAFRFCGVSSAIKGNIKMFRLNSFLPFLVYIDSLSYMN